MDSQLSEDEQKVWDILATPPMSPSDFLSPEYIFKMIEEVKAAMIAKQEREDAIR